MDYAYVVDFVNGGREYQENADPAKISVTVLVMVDTLCRSV